jgi:hypothetical protein
MIKDLKNITMKVGDTGKIEQIENGWYHSSFKPLFKCKDDCRQAAIKKLG